MFILTCCLSIAQRTMCVSELATKFAARFLMRPRSHTDSRTGLVGRPGICQKLCCGYTLPNCKCGCWTRSLREPRCRAQKQCWPGACPTLGEANCIALQRAATGAVIPSNFANVALRPGTTAYSQGHGKLSAIWKSCFHGGLGWASTWEAPSCSRQHRKQCVAPSWGLANL